MDVITVERRIYQRTKAQRGIDSLIGLIIATSGCPHTVFFNPMARCHLPLASQNETICRTASMYLLAQYFIKNEREQADLDLEGLRDIYRNIQVVNSAVADRIGAATEADSLVNTIVILDIYAQTMPYIIGESLERIRYLFDPYVSVS